MEVNAAAESGQIKTRERVRDLAEVFTHEREVAAMLDLIPETFQDIDTTFLEPACGNGNFLVEIIARKIAAISESRHGGSENWYEFALLRCLASTFAIDISGDNVAEARARLREIIDSAHALHGEAESDGFQSALDEILRTNIILGDSLAAATSIVFVEYAPLDGEQFARLPFHFEAPALDLFYEPPIALKTVHFSKLGKE